MKKIKKVLAVLIVATMAIGVASAEAATVNIKASVGENTTSSGIRVTNHNYVIEDGDFDDVFFGATNILNVESDLDSSLYNVTGNFSVLYRRNVGEKVDISVKASPLSNGDYFLNYELIINGINFNGGDKEYFDGASRILIEGIEKNTAYTASSLTNGGVVRNQALFTYNIPADINAPKGDYKATITFEATAS